MADILLVEDNEELAELIQVFLKRDGFSVEHVFCGEEAVQLIREEQKYKLLILDICLPGMDGFAICRTIRERWNLPILVISARTGREDKLNGYELGADDYMEKPVDIELLSAKIKALLQRIYGTLQDARILKSGGIEVDTEARKVFLEGRELELNVKEYELLLLFVKNPGKTLHKDYIFGEIWGLDCFSENQTLTVHIKMLRKKIEKNPREPERIRTVWGIGYRYEEI